MSVAAETGAGEGPLSDILTNTTFEGCESHDYTYDTESKRQTARERGGGNDSFI